MKLSLFFSDSSAYFRFSNLSKGFDLSVSDCDDSFVKASFRPWDRNYSLFVSAVVDYSWANGLSEISDEGLATMKNSFKDALEEIKKELEDRKA